MFLAHMLWQLFMRQFLFYVLGVFFFSLFFFGLGWRLSQFAATIKIITLNINGSYWGKLLISDD